jgi:hypothetical protein
MQPGVEFVAAPVVFQEGGQDIVAATTKDGRIVLLDAASLGGPDHGTPLFASSSLTGSFTGGASTFAAQSPALWQERSAADAAAPGDGTRWLLVPVTGRLPSGSESATNGSVSTGAILAVKVSHQGGTFSVQPGWVSENIASPLTPIVVNAVVFAASGQANAPGTLFALNGVTGKTMWQSGPTMTSPVSGRSLWTGSGHVFVGTGDGTVYAFGFAMERK